jgi:hypothetical protein
LLRNANSGQTANRWLAIRNNPAIFRISADVLLSALLLVMGSELFDSGSVPNLLRGHPAVVDFQATRFGGPLLGRFDQELAAVAGDLPAMFSAELGVWQVLCTIRFDLVFADFAKSHLLQAPPFVKEPQAKGTSVRVKKPPVWDAVVFMFFATVASSISIQPRESRPLMRIRYDEPSLRNSANLSLLLHVTSECESLSLMLILW